jgi:hypothetical protein
MGTRRERLHLTNSGFFQAMESSEHDKRWALDRSGTVRRWKAELSAPNENKQFYESMLNLCRRFVGRRTPCCRLRKNRGELHCEHLP